MKRLKPRQFHLGRWAGFSLAEVNVYSGGKRPGLTLTGGAAAVANQRSLPPYNPPLIPSFHVGAVLRNTLGLPFDASEGSDAVDYFYGRPRTRTPRLPRTF